jgi:hypothetical protein
MFGLSHLSFYLSGSGKKTVARVVADVLRALHCPLFYTYFPLSVAEFCGRFSKYSTDKHIFRTMLVDASTFLTYSLDKQEQYRQIIVEAMLSKDDSSREVVRGDLQDFLIILTGSSLEIDLILNGMSSQQSHVFDFPSMEAKEGAEYFQSLARNDGFSLDVGVLQTIEDLCLVAKELETWTNGRTVKTLWGETKLQLAHSGQSIYTSPNHSQNQIPKTIGHSCVSDAYRVMMNDPHTDIKLEASRPKLDSMQKVRDEVLSLLRKVSWQKESDTLGIGNSLFRGPKGKVLPIFVRLCARFLLMISTHK